MNQKHMDTISLKIHKDFRIKESHPHPQPSHPFYLWAWMLGTPLPSLGPLMGLLTHWPPRTFPASPLEVLFISCGLVAKWLGWVERGDVNWWERWVNRYTWNFNCGEQATQVLRRQAMCIVQGRAAFLAIGWLQIWGSSESSPRSFFSF